MELDKYIATKNLGAANLVYAGADLTNGPTKKEMAAIKSAQTAYLRSIFQVKHGLVELLRIKLLILEQDHPLI